jgi:hypothetical protein
MVCGILRKCFTVMPLYFVELIPAVHCLCQGQMGMVKNCNKNF